LYITPVIYIYFERLQQWISSRRKKKQEARAPQALGLESPH
jgi:hypothetical protein